MRERSRQLAFCGVLCALAVVILVLGSLVPLSTFCCPILAMCVLLPLREEFGPRLALGAYAVVAALGILLVPDKEAALLYLFLGYYPVLRPRLERMRPRILGLLCKLLVFNASVLLLYWLLLHVFALSEVMESFAGLSRAMLAATLAMGNLVFFLTDRALEVLTWFYRLRVRKKLFPRS